MPLPNLANLKLPSFPPLPGPHPVGSLDIEIAASVLAPAEVLPTDEKFPKTIHFRAFYPTSLEGAEKGAQRPVRWLPEPHQRQYLSGYGRFVGLGGWVSEIVSHLPKFLHYISIPALEAAPLLPQTEETGSLPILIFSHGLGGTRNAYSNICTSLASHGILVLAPEHRDGSAPITFMRETLADPDLYSEPSSSASSTHEDSTDGKKKQTKKHGHIPGKGYFSNPFAQQAKKSSVAYTSYPHVLSEEISAGRNTQLEIRCYELDLLFRFLQKLHSGSINEIPREAVHVGPNHESDDFGCLADFKGRLSDLDVPGKVVFCGHSFGAATTVQFVKSVFYATHPGSEPPPAEYSPLYTPANEFLKKQVTTETPTILLDLWCLPLLGPRTRWLFEQPLPQWHSPHGPEAILVVMSDQFFIWKEGMRAVWRVLSPRPGAKSDEIKPFTPEVLGAGKGAPRWFYVKGSRHLSQSDFGVLFPGQVGGVGGAEGERKTMALNVAAVQEFLVERGILTKAAPAMQNPNPEVVASVDGLAATMASLSFDAVGLLRPEGDNVPEEWIPLKGGEWIDSTLDPTEEAKKADKAMGRRESVHEYVESREEGDVKDGGSGEMGPRKEGVKVEGEEEIRGGEKEDFKL